MDLKRMAFDTLGVEGLEVVKDRHVVAVGEERLGEMAADESGPSGYENLYAGVSGRQFKRPPDSSSSCTNTICLHNITPGTVRTIDSYIPHPNISLAADIYALLDKS